MLWNWQTCSGSSYAINNTCTFIWARSKTHKKSQKLISNWCLTVYCLTVMMPEPRRQLKTGLSFYHFIFPHVSVNICVCYIWRYKLRHKLSIMVVVATHSTVHPLFFNSSKGDDQVRTTALVWNICIVVVTQYMRSTTNININTFLTKSCRWYLYT